MTQIKPMAASWARSFMAAAVALAMTGETDIKMLANAGLAAVLPVLLRWLNPNDIAFGVQK